jgi:hypothetical protein
MKSKLAPCCEVAEMFQVKCLDHKPVPVERAPRVKNPCAKSRKVGDPYEVWVAGDWTWNVLKKWQVDDNAPFARWFCQVVTPMTGSRGDLGDVYVKDIKTLARRVK